MLKIVKIYATSFQIGLTLEKITCNSKNILHYFLDFNIAQCYLYVD